MSKLRVSLLISLLSLLASFRSFNNFRLSFRLHVENANNDLTERDIQLDEDTIVAYMMGDFPVPTTFQLDQQAIENENSIEKIDYTKLPPHDPRFVDMPYPTEGGPLSAAYARHMLWRRKLNDGDRKNILLLFRNDRLNYKNHFQCRNSMAKMGNIQTIRLAIYF